MWNQPVTSGYGYSTGQTRPQSEHNNAANATWNGYASPPPTSAGAPNAVSSSSNFGSSNNYNRPAEMNTMNVAAGASSSNAFPNSAISGMGTPLKQVGSNSVNGSVSSHDRLAATSPPGLNYPPAQSKNSNKVVSNYKFSQ